MESAPRSPSPSELEGGNSCSKLSHQWMSSPFSQLDILSPGSAFSLSSPFSPNTSYYINDTSDKTPINMKSPLSSQLDALPRLFSPSLFSPYGKSAIKLPKKREIFSVSSLDHDIFNQSTEEKIEGNLYTFSFDESDIRLNRTLNLHILKFLTISYIKM